MSRGGRVGGLDNPYDMAGGTGPGPGSAGLSGAQRALAAGLLGAGVSIGLGVGVTAPARAEGEEPVDNTADVQQWEPEAVSGAAWESPEVSLAPQEEWAGFEEPLAHPMITTVPLAPADETRTASLAPTSEPPVAAALRQWTIPPSTELREGDPSDAQTQPGTRPLLPVQQMQPLLELPPSGLLERWDAPVSSVDDPSSNPAGVPDRTEPLLPDLEPSDPAEVREAPATRHEVVTSCMNGDADGGDVLSQVTCAGYEPDRRPPTTPQTDRIAVPSESVPQSDLPVVEPAVFPTTTDGTAGSSDESERPDRPAPLDPSALDDRQQALYDSLTAGQQQAVSAAHDTNRQWLLDRFANLSPAERDAVIVRIRHQELNPWTSVDDEPFYRPNTTGDLPGTTADETEAIGSLDETSTEILRRLPPVVQARLLTQFRIDRSTDGLAERLRQARFSEDYPWDEPVFDTDIPDQGLLGQLTPDERIDFMRIDREGQEWVAEWDSFLANRRVEAEEHVPGLRPHLDMLRSELAQAAYPRRHVLGPSVPVDRGLLEYLGGGEVSRDAEPDRDAHPMGYPWFDLAELLSRLTPGQHEAFLRLPDSLQMDMVENFGLFDHIDDLGHQIEERAAELGHPVNDVPSDWLSRTETRPDVGEEPSDGQSEGEASGGVVVPELPGYDPTLDPNAANRIEPDVPGWANGRLPDPGPGYVPEPLGGFDEGAWVGFDLDRRHREDRPDLEMPRTEFPLPREGDLLPSSPGGRAAGEGSQGSAAVAGRDSAGPGSMPVASPALTCDAGAWVVCAGSPGHPAGQPRVGSATVGAKIVGRKIVGPKIVGPKIVGPKIVGPGIEGPKEPFVESTPGWDPAPEAASGSVVGANPGEYVRRGRTAGDERSDPERALNRNPAPAAVEQPREQPSAVPGWVPAAAAGAAAVAGAVGSAVGGAVEAWQALNPSY